MTDEERFDEILEELRALLLDLGDLSSKVMLIGGQVLALESRLRGGTGVIAVATNTGTLVERGYSYEPDLLFDLDGTEFMAERLPEVLRLRGYSRTRTFRWSKDLPGGRMDLDLFAPGDVDAEALPTQMTGLPEARFALRKCRPVALSVGKSSLRILLPDAAGFLSMKERATSLRRPPNPKDCFDIYAYVSMVGLDQVKMSLGDAGEDGRALRERLRALFDAPSSRGVLDVLASAASLEDAEKRLLAQGVVDLFAEL